MTGTSFRRVFFNHQSMAGLLLLYEHKIHIMNHVCKANHIKKHVSCTNTCVLYSCMLKKYPMDHVYTYAWYVTHYTNTYVYIYIYVHIICTAHIYVCLYMIMYVSNLCSSSYGTNWYVDKLFQPWQWCSHSMIVGESNHTDTNTLW
jgi:hypothetical protein